MQLKPEVIKKFSKFKFYVSVNIPQVAKVKSIMDAIERFAGSIKTEEIEKALQWGRGPYVEPVANLTSNGSKVYGLFQGNIDPNKLKVHKWLVDRFEKGKGLVKTPNGRLVYIVGVTMLHELTHWADWKDGVDTDGEEGGRFESAVYGGEVFDPNF
ncbi:MAG: hypothetical protein IT429_18150 [Gemmataceae bacterium]|nr:hypothetical protein [Gemmataceae bacterium]